MVKICQSPYVAEQEQQDENMIREMFPYPLSDFQKYAIEAIIQGNHALVTAHTGSGKTVPAEFAIQYFCAPPKQKEVKEEEDSEQQEEQQYDGEMNGIIECRSPSRNQQRKRVIYCSPIKSLSNQKYYEFTTKYAKKKNISFGILTGDIKSNPEADVLIMTTEILLNNLYQLYSKSSSSNFVQQPLTFEMDFENELAAVIFDEVHYINDRDRGHVWEQSILLLPKNVQLIMLSATIDQPERFAKWVEDRHPESPREVWLSSTYKRVVPLTHYNFMVAPENFFKGLPDKETVAKYKKIVNTLHCIRQADGTFNPDTYHLVANTLETFRKSHFGGFVKRPFVMNQVCKYLKENDMLPAICFVLSRTQVESYAKDVTQNLLEDDSKVPYIVKRECDAIIRRLPNFEEYLELPEYQTMVQLMEKGIAFHHSGVLPIIREMVELFVARGYIKLLVATETFAIGLDCPIKTTIMSGLMKFDGSEKRLLLGHEYTQMAGRAGRRGIDVVGHTVHLNNLFPLPSLVEYQTMLSGKPQKLVSKFKISYLFILNTLQIGESFDKIILRTMANDEVDCEIRQCVGELEAVSARLAELGFKDDSQVVATAGTVANAETVAIAEAVETSLMNSVEDMFAGGMFSISSRSKNTRKKNTTHDIASKKAAAATAVQISELVEKKATLEKHLEEAKGFFTYKIQQVVDILTPVFLLPPASESSQSNPTLTLEGELATRIREINSLAMIELFRHTNHFKEFQWQELVGLFSMFTAINVADEKKVNEPLADYKDTHPLKLAAKFLEDRLLFYQNEESIRQLNTGSEYEIQYDILEPIMRWTECSDESECRAVLSSLLLNQGVFVGEFVRAVLKINKIAEEMESVASFVGDIELMAKLKLIGPNILKYVCTNQSLYV